MPADIRNFFGGGAKSSQEGGSPVKETSKAEKPKAKGRAKRKVLTDSEDDENTPPPKKATPQKATPKKPAKREAPKVEVTSTSDYFGSKKPARANGGTPKKASTLNGSNDAAPKGTPKTKQPSTPASTRSVRVSTRRAPSKNYAEDDEDDVPVLKKDDDSGEDIFKSNYQGRRGKADDDYQSDGDNDKDDDEETLPVEEKKVTASRGRKRKSVELSDDEEVPAKKPTARAAPPKKEPPKKTRTPKKKAEDEFEDKDMQNIFDSIPTVRPPTPPPRDPNQKFDWRGAQQRSAPKAIAPGSREIPQGAENCLIGLTFVFTGILESLAREEGQELVKQYGGKVTTSPSSKTDYVVLGSDAGPKKLETIKKLGIKTVNEDGLFALISKLPPNGGSGKNAQKAEEKRQADEKKIVAAAKEMDEAMKKTESQPPPGTSGKPRGADPGVDDRLWTTKYAPSQVNQVIGNRIQVERLQNWLRNWRKSAKYNFKKPGPDGMGLFRAVMLSGGPGIGKTTAAHLVAGLEGFDVVETNASDTRSKKLVETGLKGVLDATSLLGYFAGDGKKTEATKKNLVFIMDEVDGMSAGDRGGVGAMAAICKKTSVPMILICNERNQPKMKPFMGAVFDLPFRKPTTDQVRMRLQTILYREGMAKMMPPPVVNALIEGSGADIRRVINMLSTAKMDQQVMNFDDGKKMANSWEKHVVLKPWDMTQKILGGGMFAQSSKATLNDKIEIYFNDHDFAGLMLQENYLKTNPTLSSSYHGKEKALKMLELADNAAQSISDGDLCDAMIHGSQQHWSLMPTHAVLSFVRPASFMAGMMGGNVAFTSWLGNNSKGGKLSRYVKEIQAHMRLRTSADRHEVRQQYIPVLWERLVREMQQRGSEPECIEQVMELMDSYFLTKEDFDALIELGLGPQDESQAKIATQIKSSFTRKYNQASHPLPFMKAGSGPIGPPKAKDKPDLEEAVEESDDGEVLVDAAADDEEEELDLKKDKYVQAPKKKKAAAGKKGGKKGKGKRADEDEDVDVADEDAEEDEKPARGKGKGRGKPKKA